MKAAEIYLYEILELMKANAGLDTDVSDIIGTDIPVLAAQNVAPINTYPLTNVFELWNLQYRGVMIAFDINSRPGVETITLFVDALNPATGQYFAIAQSDAEDAVGQQIYFVYPAELDTDAGIAIAVLALPRRWRIRVIPSGAGDWVYSIGIQYLL